MAGNIQYGIVAINGKAVYAEPMAAGGRVIKFEDYTVSETLEMTAAARLSRHVGAMCEAVGSYGI